MKNAELGLGAETTQRELFASQEASEDMTTHSRGEAGDRVTNEQYRIHIHLLQQLACLS